MPAETVQRIVVLDGTNSPCVFIPEISDVSVPKTSFVFAPSPLPRSVSSVLFFELNLSRSSPHPKDTFPLIFSFDLSALTSSENTTLRTPFFTS